MGIDFIRKAKDTYRKGLARHALKLTYADLFTMKPEDRRTILVRPDDLACFRSGEKYTLHLEESQVHVYLSRRKIGVSINTPPSIVTCIKNMGGKTIGALHDIRTHSGLVDVVVGLGPQPSV